METLRREPASHASLNRTAKSGSPVDDRCKDLCSKKWENTAPDLSAQALWLRQQQLLLQDLHKPTSVHSSQGLHSPGKHRCPHSKSRSPARKRGNYGLACHDHPHPPWLSPGKTRVQLGKSGEVPRSYKPVLHVMLLPFRLESVLHCKAWSR